MGAIFPKRMGRAKTRRTEQEMRCPTKTGGGRLPQSRISETWRLIKRSVKHGIIRETTKQADSSHKIEKVTLGHVSSVQTPTKDFSKGAVLQVAARKENTGHHRAVKVSSFAKGTRGIMFVKGAVKGRF